jgi:hypothetical protein
MSVCCDYVDLRCARQQQRKEAEKARARTCNRTMENTAVYIYIEGLV